MPKLTLFVQAGQRIGRGVVVDPEIRIAGVRGALLLCDCGNTYESRLVNLIGRQRSGASRATSCGCAQRDAVRKWNRSEAHRERTAEINRETKRTHGLSQAPLYDAWRCILRRCENPENPRFKDYGGRGIKVCPEWHDVSVFIAWVEENLGARPALGMSLDRIDNDGSYEPGNLRWATASQQVRNSRPRRRRQTQLAQ